MKVRNQMTYIKKFIALCLISASILQAMEENPGESNNLDLDYVSDFKEEGDIDWQYKLLLDEAKRQSIETEEQRQLLDIIVNGQLATWQMLPDELKLYIFSFIPYAMKHLMLIDKNSKALTELRIFLQEVANVLVTENPKKAIETFGHAIETENNILTKSLLKAGIMEMVTKEEGFENSSIESFVQAIISKNLKIAHKIFVKAAQKNNMPIIQAFLNIGIDIDNAHNSLGNNALMEASYHGNQELAQLLINHSANINIQNQYGYAPLHFAVMNGQIIMVEFLVNHNDINIEIKTNIFRTTPLIIAAKLGYKTILELLIDHHANVNAEELTKHTALIYASINGHFDIVAFLLKHDANARIQTIQPKYWFRFSNKVQNQLSNICYGYSALMYACEEGHEIIAEELLPHSDINAKNADGSTTLDCVLKKYQSHVNKNYESHPSSDIDKYKKIFDLLIRNGARIPKETSRCLVS